MTDKGSHLGYFHNWPEADGVLSHLVDVMFGVKRDEAVADVTYPDIVDHFVPEEYRSVFHAIYRTFMNEFVFVPDSKDFTRLILRALVDRTALVALATWIGDNARLRTVTLESKYGMQVRDVLKGWLGIEPYRSKIPPEVHKRIFNTLVLEGMGIREG